MTPTDIPDIPPPHQVVENAREYIRCNLHHNLTPLVIARAIGVGLQDLIGSYKCATITTVIQDIAKIRLHAFYESIKMDPSSRSEDLARLHGLLYGEDLERDFESEFWISIQDHRESSVRNQWKRKN